MCLINKKKEWGIEKWEVEHVELLFTNKSPFGSVFKKHF